MPMLLLRPCQAYHICPGERGDVLTTYSSRMMAPFRRRVTMKKSKRNKAQKRQQVLQRRRQQTSIRRPLTQIPPESADQVAMTTTGEILQLIRLHYAVEDSEKLRTLFTSLRCLEYDASQARWVWLYTEEARTLPFKDRRAGTNVVLGEFVFKGETDIVLNLRSFERATNALVFFDHHMPRTVARVTARYCPPLAAKARDIVSKHYQQFLDYYGTDLVTYPDGKTMAGDLQKFHQYQFTWAPREEVEAFLKRHHLSAPSPQVDWSPELLACDDGIGVYFNPAEGQEMMMSFDDVRRGFHKQGGDLTADEAEMVRQFLYSDAISPQFVRKLVQEYGDASIAAAFLIPQDSDKYFLEYLLRRYKGHFYRKRYPSLSIVDA